MIIVSPREYPHSARLWLNVNQKKNKEKESMSWKKIEEARSEEAMNKHLPSDMKEIPFVPLAEIKDEPITLIRASMYVNKGGKEGFNVMFRDKANITQRTVVLGNTVVSMLKYCAENNLDLSEQGTCKFTMTDFEGRQMWIIEGVE